MYGFLLIMVVIGISGLIAYVGDQIGMKVGKKRISIFGLRPRHTSILITIMTGILIAALTITVILATNNGVRRALFNIQEVVGMLQETRTELDKLDQQLLLKDQQLQEKEQEIRSKESELTNLQTQKEQLDEENRTLEEEKNELNNILENIQEEYNKIQSEYQAAQTNIDDLNEIKIELENQLSALETEKKNLKSEIGSLESEISQLEDVVVELDQEIKRVNKELHDNTAIFYQEDLVYVKGDIIHRGVVKKGDTQDEIVENIMNFIDKANQEVSQKPVKVFEETGNPFRLRFEEIPALGNYILQSDSDQFIVSLVAEANILKNKPVYAQFQINEDFVVYEHGDIITSKTIDTEQSVTDIEIELREILKDVNVNSVKNGVLKDEQGTVGTIEFSRFYEILNIIRSYENEVEIRVVVIEDIRREDGWNGKLSKKIDFIIEPTGE
ncbi:MAG: DUF3084 domain-containing protein [Halanaerobiaceae bacterium]